MKVKVAQVVVISLILVLCSGMAHAVWNLFTKQSENKSVFLWLIFIPVTVVLLPTLFMELASKSLPVVAFVWMGLSMAMQAIYATLLSRTYQMGDLSQVYPVMRGTATLLIPLLGVLVFGESLAAWGWIGITCMLIGFFLMSGWTWKKNQFTTSYKPWLYALSVGLCVTCYTLIDKQNLLYLSPLSLLALTNIGFIIGLTPSVIKSRRVKSVLRSNWQTFIIGSVLSPGSYLLFLFAMQHVQVSYISPLREVGIVFGTVLGILVLKEKSGMRRIAAACSVVAGILLIAFSGF
ncbi:EamA family transporter [Paenibacillus sp. GCM10027629]|uniref:EamA family transporter n=1 Tax=Paenibacillus sp. GCM10027629 TaxID=3273414 RepID=UPI0036D28C62